LAEEFQILCPVVELSVKYKKSARYDDLLTIHTVIKELSAVRIFFEQKIYNQYNELLSEGSTVNCCVDCNTLKPVKLPKELHQLFKSV
jgi:acyl-CoA thioester hydrolase